MPDAFLLEANPGFAPSLEKFVITEDVTIPNEAGSRRGRSVATSNNQSSSRGHAVLDQRSLAYCGDTMI